MLKRYFQRTVVVVCLVLLMGLAVGCGGSGDEIEVTIQDIPIYPLATAGESLATSMPGGIMEGNLAQYSTTDSYDDVLAFYTSALEKYQPQVETLTSDLGRQTAMSIEQENGVISVAIQEFLQEDRVNITLMNLGM